jgi:hypothetical protein
LALLVPAVVAGVYLGTSLLARPTSAFAANMIAISQASGGSAATFNLTLPNSAACGLATNKPGGDLLDSYVVDDAKVPVSEVPNLTFGAGGFDGAILEQNGGSPYVNQPTLPVTGQVPAPSSFSWKPYADLQDFGPGLDLYPGTFNLGIACVAPSGKIDGDNFWNVQLTFAASQTDPGHFTWALKPFATSVALTASPAGGAVPGASVTLKATVSPATAPGSVTFYDRSTALGTAPVVVNGGVATATLVTGTLATGTNSLTAAYTPQQYNSVQLQADDVYAASTSPPLTYTVGTQSTSTSTPSGGTTTTTAPGGGTSATTTPVDSGAGGTGGSGSSGPGSASTGGSSGGSGSTGSGSTDPALAATGEPIAAEVFAAVLIVVAGLFLLSFAIPTVGRNRIR